eukprot:g7019.t1
MRFAVRAVLRGGGSRALCGLCRARQLHLQSAVASHPHPGKANGRGEDGHFVFGSFVGVADGVGGWARKGIDAGRYSNLLMQCCTEFIQSGVTARGGEGFVPIEAMKHAFEGTDVPGSSTACVVGVQNEHLIAANLGDSGFMLMREELEGDAAGAAASAWGVVAASSPQLHYFNCPLQLSFGGPDQPEHSATFTVPVMPGDIVLTATDGLFDNLFEEDILAVVSRCVENINQHQHMGKAFHGDADVRAELLQGMASSIALRAQRVAECNSTCTPFSEAAQAEGGQFKGGKMDDITVVCSCVYEE